MTKNRRCGPLLWVLWLFFVLVAPPAQAQSELMDVFESSDALGGFDDPFPLRPANTSSPRDTLRSFMRNTAEAVEAWRSDRPIEQVARSMLRASDTLDTEDIASLDRRGVIAIRAVLLREILDRVDLPPFEEIPGRADVEQSELRRWTIPNTKIDIVRIEEGPRAGEFLFSRETVAQLRQLHELASVLPYRSGALIGIYDELRRSPGPWLPYALTRDWPDWLNAVVAGQGVWQWIGLALLVIVFIGLALVIYRLGAAWDRRFGARNPWLNFGVPVALLFVVIVAEIARNAAQYGIGLYELPLQGVSYGAYFVEVSSLAWFVIAVSGRLAEAIGRRHPGPGQQPQIATAFLRILLRLLSIIVLVLLGVAAAEAIGIPIAPLVASIGVGGLALALAVRQTMENVIGGLTLFADRPVRVGDFCRYGDQIGTVEQIGLRSTRIRSLERTIVTVPNAEFSQMQLDNFTARDMRLLKTVLQLRYETTPDQMRYVLTELRKLLLGHPMVTPEPARARFIGYGAFSKDIEIFAYLRTSDHGEFLAIQEDILLRMEDIINESGSGFAFPSQTLYLSRDGGLDQERARAAEDAVEDWREHHRLPFPEFDPGLRWEMEDVLDYPPRGSPAHKPRLGLSEETPPEPPETMAKAKPAPTKTR
jgi:MscS family membrane protein